MWKLPKIILTCLFVGALLLISSVAVAEESVSVEVRTIYASTDGEECERSLRRFCGRLERGFAGFSSFQQLDHQRLRVEKGESASFSLPTRATVTVTNNGRVDDFVKLGLEIDDRLNTTLRASPGSTFFQAGLRHREGILILAITVE